MVSKNGKVTGIIKILYVIGNKKSNKKTLPNVFPRCELSLK